MNVAHPAIHADADYAQTAFSIGPGARGAALADLKAGLTDDQKHQAALRREALKRDLEEQMRVKREADEKKKQQLKEQEEKEEAALQAYYRRQALSAAEEQPGLAHGAMLGPRNVENVPIRPAALIAQHLTQQGLEKAGGMTQTSAPGLTSPLMQPDSDRQTACCQEPFTVQHSDSLNCSSASGQPVSTTYRSSSHSLLTPANPTVPSYHPFMGQYPVQGLMHYPWPSSLPAAVFPGLENSSLQVR